MILPNKNYFKGIKMAHPIVVREQTEGGIDQYDIFSRLAKDRIILLDTDFNDAMASVVVGQLLFLSQQSDEDITVYVNSPGGSCTSGLAIYDTMQMIPNNVKTVVLGQAASMGAFFLSAGTKGMRCAAPSSRIMIHRVSGGAQGALPDMEITLEEARRLNDYLTERMALHCGKTVAQMKKYLDRDTWMTAEEAKKFGLIDQVLETSKNAW
jgi:ATP-dependent Clp protease protease subunit